jgi:hypothetical protein
MNNDNARRFEKHCAKDLRLTAWAEPSTYWCRTLQILEILLAGEAVQQVSKICKCLLNHLFSTLVYHILVSLTMLNYVVLHLPSFPSEACCPIFYVRLAVAIRINGINLTLPQDHLLLTVGFKSAY